MNSRMWKIRHKVTGLYSTGGTCPGWTKKGKVWRMLGHLKNHLAQVQDYSGYRGYNTTDFQNWEIVELIITEVGTQPVEQMLVELQQARIERKTKLRLAAERATRERKEAEYERLKRELGK